MQSLLLKLQADIEARKRPHWDIACQLPERPPSLRRRRIPPISIPRSRALHMS